MLLLIRAFDYISQFPCFANLKLSISKSKILSKPKQQGQVVVTRNWLELPSDLMINILQRVGVADRLTNAQLVCTAWREICKDPAMWRVVYINSVLRHPVEDAILQEMCKHAVDRSQGQMLDLTAIDGFDELLQYVVDRSSQLRRLELAFYYDKQLSEALKKLHLLEELSLLRVKISHEDIEVVGRYCPLLKTLKVNQDAFLPRSKDFMTFDNKIALAIGKNLPELTQLELIRSGIQTNGLQAILHGCCHLESLDLRGCLNLNLKGDLGKRCSQQIKYLKLPHDSLEGCAHITKVLDYSIDEYSAYYDYGFISKCH